MRKISVIGVLSGGIVDWVAVKVISILFIALVMAAYGLRQLPLDQLQPAVNATIHHNFVLYAVQLLIPLGCSVLGGYVGALIAKHDQLLNAFLACCFAAAIGFYSPILEKGSLFGNLEIIAGPIVGLLGGYFALVHKRGRRQLATTSS